MYIAFKIHYKEAMETFQFFDKEKKMIIKDIIDYRFPNDHGLIMIGLSGEDAKVCQKLIKDDVIENYGFVDELDNKDDITFQKIMKRNGMHENYNEPYDMYHVIDFVDKVVWCAKPI